MGIRAAKGNGSSHYTFISHVKEMLIKIAHKNLTQVRWRFLQTKTKHNDLKRKNTCFAKNLLLNRKKRIFICV